MEPTARRRRLSLQWGHDEGVVEGDASTTSVARPESCFNGATTKASWKASVDGTSTEPHERFNGATTKASWKATTSSRSTAAAGQLQWGHDEGVVEGVRASADALTLRSALQWGHDEGVVEGG